MKVSSFSKCAGALALLAAFGLAAGGCNSSSPTEPGKGGPPIKHKDADGAAKDDHSGWWCNEHGLPEEVCDRCSSKYRNAEKKKGNWCEHDRVKTSCFECNPGLQAKWAKVYEEKLGTKPPELEPEGNDGKAKKGGE